MSIIRIASTIDCEGLIRVFFQSLIGFYYIPRRNTGLVVAGRKSIYNNRAYPNDEIFNDS